MVSPPQPSDSPILVIRPCSEAHPANFVVIQTHTSCRFLLTVDSIGLRRSGSWLQAVNQAQDVGEQSSRDCTLGKLERDIATVAEGPLLDKLK